MKYLAIVMLIGCGSTTTSPTPSNRPTRPTFASPADPLVYCDLAIQTIDELTACTQSPASQFELLRASMIRDRNLGAVFVRKSAAFCATFLEQLLIDPSGPKCTYTVAPRRAELTAFVDGYLAERTVPTPTGDPRRDRALQALATHRDEVCACPDQACTRRVQDAYLAGPIEPVGREAAVLEVADKILDEVSRCSGDMRWLRKR